ncbi:hypothetical protein OAU89_03135 [bacterium]|nr:hypothetical protein [bacterium]
MEIKVSFEISNSGSPPSEQIINVMSFGMSSRNLATGFKVSSSSSVVIVADKQLLSFTSI